MTEDSQSKLVAIDAPHAVSDTRGRPLLDLRISVMDRCNFRCPYCMPRETFGEGYRFLPAAARLTFDEIARLARAFAAEGVRKIRLTGGEPLLRTGLPDLVGDLSAIDGIKDLALTTRDREPRLHRSRDVPAHERRVRRARPRAGRHPRGARGGARPGQGQRGRAAGGERRPGPRPRAPLPGYRGGGALHRVHGRRQRFISSVTQPFCGGCTRARLSSDGVFYTCLFATAGTDFRAVLRSGADQAGLRERIRAVWRRRADRYSELRERPADEARPRRIEMYYIGG
jgi:molybdenum cofactor biosynthesis enzyme MoaA